jgi:hypothetical protein
MTIFGYCEQLKPLLPPIIPVNLHNDGVAGKPFFFVQVFLAWVFFPSQNGKQTNGFYGISSFPSVENSFFIFSHLLSIFG